MSNQAELVFIPTPGMGHILPTVEVAKLILQRDERISVSIHIINLPIISAKINAFVDSQSRDNPYPTRLTFVTFPPLSHPPDSPPPFSFTTTIDLHKPLVKQAVEDRVKSGLPKPVGFVLDMFCTGMMEVANELNIPSYIFFTSGSGLLNFLFYAQLLNDDKGIEVTSEFNKPEFSALVPGFKNPVTSAAIPAVIQDKGNGSDLFLEFARRFRETKGILVNSYMELEPNGIQSLLNNENGKIPQIYPVGPILDIDSGSRGGSDTNENESVIQWLDAQPQSSVVFLCFGSMGYFEEEQVKEIANGLEKSGQRFLWALRKPPTEGKLGTNGNDTLFLDALPEGFIDRTADKGKIIGWAPQVEVLAHPAVGGFVSHCGWNSTLESLWFGVPMATWPIYAEQQMNALTLVKELGLAVEIRMDYKKDMKLQKGNFLVTAEEIEKGVTALMNMDEEKRGNVKKISEFGKNALKEGGSSYNWLGRFINDVISNAAHTKA